MGVVKKRRIVFNQKVTPEQKAKTEEG